MAVTLDREHWLLDKRREIEERYDRVFVHGLSYQHFPTDEQIHGWVDETALVVIKDGRGDGCRHFAVAAEGSVDPTSGL